MRLSKSPQRCHALAWRQTHYTPLLKHQAVEQALRSWGAAAHAPPRALPRSPRPIKTTAMTPT